jgi:hypothetical protein
MAMAGILRCMNEIDPVGIEQVDPGSLRWTLPGLQDVQGFVDTLVSADLQKYSAGDRQLEYDPAACDEPGRRIPQTRESSPGSGSTSLNA